MNNSPIGIFDSGIGGLTVFKEIAVALPNEDLVYLGDVARVPYGGRSKETISQFALEMAKFLLKKKVKALVVACNTISANSLEELKSISPVPVIDVISPTVKQAAKISPNLNIGIIGTRATMNSNVYKNSLKDIDSKTKVYSVACPLFVPFVEEGETSGDAIHLVARQYLKKLKDVDSVILGCTHYPILLDVISETLGPNVQIISSGPPTAKELKKTLLDRNLLSEPKVGKQKLYVTDIGQNTDSLVQNILRVGKQVSLEKISLND